MRHPARLLAGALITALLLPLLAAPWDGGALLPPARAEVSYEARTPAEIFERKSRIVDCLEYVAKDLKARWDADSTQPPAELLLLVDPTTSMKDEIAALQKGLPRAWAIGPPGLRIGVEGLLTGEFQEPSRIPNDADGHLASLAFLPVDGPKNVHSGIREAARRFAARASGPKAILLVSQGFTGAEDDVEDTREVLFDCGAAFYCVAEEAGFERTWVQEFEARDYSSAGLTERYNPMPRKKVKNALYYGGEVAFGLVPYRWEFDLAQADFVWVRPPRYPVPSGFGYWSLATLCYTTGGRYFIYDFGLPAGHPWRDPKTESKGKERYEQNRTVYDYSRLALLAPDLRPRSKILKALVKDWRAQAIVRIWQHLADDALPVVQRIGALERRGGTLVPRPERPVRSQAPALTWFTGMDDVRKAAAFVQKRLSAVETAIKWWESANGKERRGKPGQDPLKERIEADFQLLGVQLRKVRFHHNEALVALKSIKPLDVSYRRARIVPRPIASGVDMPRRPVDLEDDERNARFAEVFLAQGRMARRYPDTPWSLLLKKGWLVTFVKEVQILPSEREPTRPDPRDRNGGRGDKKEKPPPRPTPTPPPPPPPGPRPGSSGGGPVTGR